MKKIKFFSFQIVLCFSPVGSTLRVRGRKFPALVNCCSIDWFHSWPHDALVRVSRRFVAEIDELGFDESKNKISANIVDSSVLKKH